MHSDTADIQHPNVCPRCHAPHLHAWHELTDEERRLVQSLPASVDYSLDERIARHQWCTRCWHEGTTGAPGDA